MVLLIVFVVRKVVVGMSLKNDQLTRLADTLEDLPKNRFSLSHWVSSRAPFTGRSMADVLDINICGTAGCLGGWALALDNDGVFNTNSYRDFGKVSFFNNICDAAAKALDLSVEEGSQLFLYDDNSLWWRYADEIGITRIYDDGDRYDCNEVNPESITKDIAVDMLRKLVSGEYIFGFEDFVADGNNDWMNEREYDADDY